MPRRRRPFLPPLLLLLALAAVARAAAPCSAQEPLPDDPAATLYQAARQLEAEGELDLADSILDYVLRRYPDSAAAAAIRRARSRPDSRRIDSSGRTELVVFGTLYGLWAGLAVPGTFGADSPEPYGLGLLVGGPLGFMVSRRVTAATPVSDGAAGAISWGGTWGTWQGFGWAHVLDIGASCETGPVFEGRCDADPASEALFGFALGSGVLGTLGGAAIARRYELAPGDATMASLGSLWGTWYGTAIGILVDLEDDALLASALVGGNAGLLAGVAITARHRVSRGRARVASIAGVAGGLAGAGIDLLIQPSDEKVAIAIPLVSSTLGLLVGASRGRDRDPAPDSDARPGGALEPSGRGVDWAIGGPLLPMMVDGPGGQPRPALGLTLLSARF